MFTIIINIHLLVFKIIFKFALKLLKLVLIPSVETSIFFTVKTYRNN